MPRTGGVYTEPAGTKGTPNTTIQSAPYNAFVDDLVGDANAARPITAGGTGATNATTARTNLGLEIGVNVQAYDADLTAFANITIAANQIPYGTGAAAWATTALTPFARTVLDDADATAFRATLGLGSLATASTVNNGDWSGTDLSIANGGTGASTVAAALTNFGASAFFQTLFPAASAAAFIALVGLRTLVTSTYNLYVNTSTGNDVTNDGLTAGTPFKTISRAIRVAYELDLRTATVQINVADGLYGETLYLYGSPVWSSGPATQLAVPIKIVGNTTTPANVSITNDAAGGPVRLRSGAIVQFEGLRFVSFTSGCTAFDVQDAGSHAIVGNCNLSQFAGGNHFFSSDGGKISVISNYSIAGGAATHYHATEHSEIRVYNAPTVTITGTPAFSNFFAGVSNSLLYARSITWSGAATGQRFFVHRNGVIDTNSAGANYFPGNVAGVAQTGGVHDDYVTGRTILLAQPGYVKNDDGTIRQWGFSAFNNANTIAFPMTFPNNCFGVIATPAAAPPSTGLYASHYTAATVSNFLAHGRQFSGGAGSTVSLSSSWEAWGN